jgi:2-phosphoglycerate kinase
MDDALTMHSTSHPDGISHRGHREHGGTETPADSAPLRERLRHVYWIGGGSGAGKSTIARRIAAQRGLRVYATDDVMADHARRSTREDAPLLHRFMAMEMDERWVERSPRTMLETFHWFQGEGFEMIIEDLLRLPREPGIVVEGFRLLPRLVEPLLSIPAQAVWLLPTPDFRRAVVESRGGSASGFLARTTDPQKALRNLLDRDRMFTDVLREETARLGVPTIEVDATMTEDELARRVTYVLGL